MNPHLCYIFPALYHMALLHSHQAANQHFNAVTCDCPLQSLAFLPLSLPPSIHPSIHPSLFSQTQISFRYSQGFKKLGSSLVQMNWRVTSSSGDSMIAHICCRVLRSQPFHFTISCQAKLPINWLPHKALGHTFVIHSIQGINHSVKLQRKERKTCCSFDSLESKQINELLSPVVTEIFSRKKKEILLHAPNTL